MASAWSDPGIVHGRVDPDGRLVAADAPLADLQSQAGSSLGARLALPQIAAVARLARQLSVPVSRSVIAAGESHDYDLWVRATLDGEDVLLEIEGWRPRQPAAPRLDLVVAADDDATIAQDPTTGRWATDAELRLTAMAPDLAARLGIDPGDAIGQPLTRFLKLDEEEDGSLPLLAGLASRTAFSGQAARPRAGEVTQLHLSADVLRDDDGHFVGFAGRALPTTPALAVVDPPAPASTAAMDGLNEQLDRSLRTPLDRIIAAADKIVERSDGPLRSDYAGYASDIAAAGRHLLSVIEAMSQGAMAPEQVDLRTCATEAIALLTASAETRGVTLELTAGTAFARGEARGIVQIIVNILGNAIRHSPANGLVNIAVWAEDGRARVTVIDRGEGIAPADQQRIFQRFERLGSDAPDGTGLGLAIARRLAQAMGGDILLDSTPSEGARFTIDLPAA